MPLTAALALLTTMMALIGYNHNTTKIDHCHADYHLLPPPRSLISPPRPRSVATCACTQGLALKSPKQPSWTASMRWSGSPPSIFCRLEQYLMYSIPSDMLGPTARLRQDLLSYAPRRPDSHSITATTCQTKPWVKTLEGLKNKLAQAPKSSKSPPCSGRHLVDTAALDKPWLDDGAAQGFTRVRRFL